MIRICTSNCREPSETIVSFSPSTRPFAALITARGRNIYINRASSSEDSYWILELYVNGDVNRFCICFIFYNANRTIDNPHSITKGKITNYWKYPLQEPSSSRAQISKGQAEGHYPILVQIRSSDDEHIANRLSSEYITIFLVKREKSQQERGPRT